MLMDALVRVARAWWVAAMCVVAVALAGEARAADPAAETAALTAEAARLEQAVKDAEAQLAEAEARREALAARRQDYGALMVVTKLGTKGQVALLGTLLFLVSALVLSIFRPASTLGRFNGPWVRRQLAPLFTMQPAGAHRVTQAAAVALVLLALLLLLLLPATAKAQQGAPSPGDTLRSVNAAISDKGVGGKIARLEWLKADKQHRALALTATPLSSKHTAVFTQVERNSFEHLYSLGALYLEAGDKTRARAAFEQALTLRSRGQRPEYERAVADLQKAYQEAGWLDGAPDRLEWVVKNVTALYLLLDLARYFEKIRPPWTARLVDVARQRARGVQQSIALAGYLREKGDTEKLGATIEAAKKDIAKMRRVAELVEAAEAYRRAGFDDLLALALAQAGKQARATADVLLYAGFCLHNGRRDDGAAALAAAAGSLGETPALLHLSGFAHDEGLAEVALKAAARALERADSFPEARAVVEHAQKPGMESLRQPSLERALDLAKDVRQLEWLTERAQAGGMADLARRAMTRAAETARSTRELETVIAQAVERGDLAIAAAAATALYRKDRGRTVEAESMGLAPGAFPAGAGKQCTYASQVALLYHRAGTTTAGTDFLIETLEPLFTPMVFDELARVPRARGALMLNDLHVLRHLLGEAGNAAAAAEVEPIIRAAQAAFAAAPATTANQAAAARRKLQERVNGLRAELAALEKRAATARADAERQEPLVAAARAAALRELARLLVMLLVALMFVVVPLFAALEAAHEAPNFKAFAFVMRWMEVLGWMWCLTWIALPAGLLQLLGAQALRILASIERNTQPAVPAATLEPLAPEEMAE